MGLFKGGKKTAITGDEIFEFYDKNIPDDPNTTLELKYLIKKSEIEESPSILKYLDNDLGFNLEEDLLKKDFNDNLGDTLHFKKSSLKHLYKQVKNARPEIANPNIVDFYTILLNHRDQDLLAGQLNDPKKIKSKIQKFLSKEYKNSADPISDLNKNSKGTKACTEFEFSNDNDEEISLAEFMEIFVEKKEYVTPSEGIVLFDDINETPQGAMKNPRPKVLCSKVYQYFSGKKRAPSRSPSPEEKETPEKESPKSKSSKRSVCPDKSESIIHRIEKEEKKYIPLIFNSFKEQKMVTKSGLTRGLSKIYNTDDKKYSKEEIDEAADAILGSKDKLRFNIFYSSVKESTLKAPEKVNTKELFKLLKEEIKLAGDKEPFNPEKNSGFVNTILKDKKLTKNDDYMKYNLLEEYYTNEDDYKASARKYVKKIADTNMKNKEKSVPLPSEKGDKDDKEDIEKEKIPDKSKKPGGIAGVLTGGTDEEDKVQDPKNLLNKFKGKLEVDFSKLIQARLDNTSRKSIKLKPEEREQFNNIMKGFIKDFTKIIPEEDIKEKGDRLVNLDKNIKIMDIFNRERGGSKKMQDLIKKYNNKEVKTSNIDLLDLWKEVDRWPKFDIKKDEKQKYIFTFLKLNPTTFTVNLKDLEKFYVKTTKSNKKYKVVEMEEILMSLKDDLSVIGQNDGQDPNESLHFESKVKIKGGVRYNSGSVEELIHKLIEYSKKNTEGEKSLLSIYKERVYSKEEADIHDLQAILDTAGIKNNDIQRKDLLRLLDSDKDLHLSYDELKDFLETYNK